MTALHACSRCGAETTSACRVCQQPADVGDGWAARARAAETYTAVLLADLHHVTAQRDQLAHRLAALEDQEPPPC